MKKRLLAVALMMLAGSSCVSMKQMIRDIIEDAKKPEQPAEPAEPSDPAQPPSGADAAAFSALRWNRGGMDAAGAVRDERVTIRDVRIHPGGTPYLTYAGDGLAAWGASESNITHVWAIFFDENGDGIYERGGKFDWGRSNAQARPLQHINRLYSNWDGYPARGTPWAGVIVDAGGRRRSNVVKGVWP